MSSEGLKPCPYCGGQTLYSKHDPTVLTEFEYWVECLTCGARGPDRDHHGSAEDAWNKRVLPVPTATYQGFRLLEILDKPKDGGEDE